MYKVASYNTTQLIGPNILNQTYRDTDHIEEEIKKAGFVIVEGWEDYQEGGTVKFIRIGKNDLHEMLYAYRKENESV